MAFARRMLEWRQLEAGQMWHLFLINKSLCGSKTSNGHFNFAETKPTDKKCQLCLKASAVLKSRCTEVL